MEPTHPQGQVENATAPLREILRIRFGKRLPFSDDLQLGIGVGVGVGIGIGIGIDGMYDSAWNIHVQNVLIRPPTSGLSHGPAASGNWPLVGHVPDFPVCIAFIAAGCRGRWTGLEGPPGAVVPDIEPSKQDLAIG